MLLGNASLMIPLFIQALFLSSFYQVRQTSSETFSVLMVTKEALQRKHAEEEIQVCYVASLYVCACVELNLKLINVRAFSI